MRYIGHFWRPPESAWPIFRPKFAIQKDSPFFFKKKASEKKQQKSFRFCLSALVGWQWCVVHQGCPATGGGRPPEGVASVRPQWDHQERERCRSAGQRVASATICIPHRTGSPNPQTWPGPSVYRWMWKKKNFSGGDSMAKLTLVPGQDAYGIGFPPKQVNCQRVRLLQREMELEHTSKCLAKPCPCTASRCGMHPPGIIFFQP